MSFQPTPLTRRWALQLSLLRTHALTPARRELLREHAPLLYLVGAYTAFSLTVQASFGRLNAVQLVLTHTTLNMISCLIVLVAVSVYALVQFPSVPPGASPIRWIGGRVRRAFFTERRVLGFLLMHLAIPVFSSSWGAYKLLIPKIQPFAWDSTLHAADTALHFGHEPAQLLMPLMGHPLITVATNAAYHFWVLLMLGVLGWQAASAKRDVRFRFFMTFFLLWAIPGTLVATALSSAGPCYYDAVVTGANPYLEQFGYLKDVHATYGLGALERQQMLWESYAGDIVRIKSGISAMPSMHVCMSTLFCLVGFARSQWLGVPLLGFAIWIQAGSVHLGWHYALDGYVGAACAVTTWWAVGKAMRRFGWSPSDLPPAAEPPEPRTA